MQDRKREFKEIWVLYVVFSKENFITFLENIENIILFFIYFILLNKC